METVNALGRRKEAVARVYVNEGAGKIVINGRDIENHTRKEKWYRKDRSVLYRKR